MKNKNPACENNNLEKILSRWLDSHPSQRALVVAYSGGKDSRALLEALFRLKRVREDFSLRALHVDHGLQVLSPTWSQHCADICETLGIPLQVIALHLAKKRYPGQSLEAVAREARYQALESHLFDDETLLTAHHQADQAETFLLQLLRGSSPKGLQGIAAFKKLLKGSLARPLLATPQAVIDTFVERHQLLWKEDGSNQDQRFDRNFLRHAVLPILSQTYPQATRAIARSAQHCASTQRLLEEYLENDLQACLNAPLRLHVAVLKTHSFAKQAEILRFWLSKNGQRMPGRKKLGEFLRQCNEAGAAAQPVLAWDQAQLRFFGGELYLLLGPVENNVKITICWDLAEKLILPDGSAWCARLTRGKGIDSQRLTGPVTVRFRQGGERCQIAGNLHSQPLKKIFQAQGTPPWVRPNLPLFYQAQALVGVAGMFVCEGWQVRDREALGWVIAPQ